MVTITAMGIAILPQSLPFWATTTGFSFFFFGWLLCCAHNKACACSFSNLSFSFFSLNSSLILSHSVSQSRMFLASLVVFPFASRNLCASKQGIFWSLAIFYHSLTSLILPHAHWAIIFFLHWTTQGPGWQISVQVWTHLGRAFWHTCPHINSLERSSASWVWWQGIDFLIDPQWQDNLIPTTQIGHSFKWQGRGQGCLRFSRNFNEFYVLAGWISWNLTR